MELSNLLSGGVGALIILFIQFVHKSINEQRRLKVERDMLVSYINSIVRPCIERFKSDCANAIIAIEPQYRNIKPEDQYSFSSMPTLSTAFIDSFSNPRLMELSCESNLFLKIINLNGNIKYLKSKMPLDMIEDYNRRVKNHFFENKITDPTIRFKEIESGETINYFRSHSMKMIQIRIRNCEQCLLLSEEIISEFRKIKGPFDN